jgi:hypothetical protein
MSLPASVKVEVRFATGASFGNVLVLGSATDGILGQNVLGTTSVQPVDITSQVTRVSIANGRDRVFDHYNSGTCTVQLLDTTGNWNPENTSSPYYPNILPMRQIRISATYSATKYYLFSGYITSFDYQYQPGLKAAIVTITAADAFRLLNLATVSTVSGTAAGDLPGVRIGKILDAISWPAGMRDIDNGAITMAADPGTTRSALDALWDCEDVELGALYTDPEGNVVFKDQNAQALEAAGTPTKFDDDGTDIEYNQIDVNLDDTELANYVIVQRFGGTAQVAQDATSISTYFRRSYSRTGLLFQTDTQAAQQANDILNNRKNVEIRIESFTLDLSGPSTRITPGLSLGIGSPIQIARTQPGGSRIVADLTVQGIRHEITPSTWQTTFTTAKSLGSAFILGSTIFGVLGTSVL